MEFKEMSNKMICPICRSKISIEGDVIKCQNDSSHLFNFANDIPVLLSHEDYKEFGELIENTPCMNREYKEGVVSKLSKLTKKLIGSTLHLPLSKKMTEKWSDTTALKLEVGSGVKQTDNNQINIDIGPFNNVDVVCSGSNIPFADESFDRVKSVAVLEHVKQPIEMVSEMHRVLKKGGYIYTEVPFMQHFHAYPNDFQRYTIQGLKEMHKEFTVVESGVCVGPSSTVTAIITDWFELFSFSKNRTINDLFRLIPLITLLPLKYLDYILVKYNPRSHEIASGVYILCRKD